MTDQQHPITPPPEQLRQWQIQIEYCSTRVSREALVAQIFAAGADQELEACCGWLMAGWDDVRADKLRAARRPKPPSLKEQALEALDEEHADMRIQNYKLIRSVLESLPS